MEIDASNPKRVTYLYVWADSDNPTNSTHGDLTVTISGGEDGAGNTHATINTTILNDVAVPPAPTVVLDAVKHDFGDLVKWDVTQAPAGVPAGSNSGEVFYLILPQGDPAPTQRTKQVLGVTVNDGFYAAYDAATTYGLGDRARVGDDIWESKIASNTGNTVEEGDNWTKLSLTFGETSIGTGVFEDFTQNGNFEVYFYFVSNTGNVSANSGALSVTMN